MMPNSPKDPSTALRVTNDRIRQCHSERSEESYYKFTQY